MRREEYKLHSNNFTNTLLDTLKDVIPSSSSTNKSSDLRRLNDVWASKLRSTRIVEASIFKHLHSELASLPFVSPLTQQHTNKCKSFLSETQTSFTNETFYLGRLLEFRKLPHLKDLREASGRKLSTPTKPSSVDSGQDMLETLIQSFEAAELYSKQAKVMTNDQLEKQIRYFTSLISKYVKTPEEKDKLNNLIHSPSTNDAQSPKDTRNVFNDVNRVPVSSSCPSLGPNNRVHLSLIPQLSELSINTMSPTKSKQVFEPYFHSKELKLSVAGENSKNVLEFKTHLRRVIYQCFSDLASSYGKEKENVDDERSLGVLFDRNRVYLFEFILTRKFISNTNSNSNNSQSLPTILIDAVGVNYTNGGQGMALIFTTLLQYLREGWKMFKETSDPLHLLHLSLLKFVYQQAKREITTSSSSNLSNNSMIATSLHSKSTSDLSSVVVSSEPQVLSPSYSPTTLNTSIGSLLFSAINTSSSSSNNSTISPVRSNAFTSDTDISSPPSPLMTDRINQTTLSDNAFLTCSHVNSNSLDLSNISSPPPSVPQHYDLGVAQNFGSPTNCKSSALSAEQQRAINSIAIVSRTASTKTSMLQGQSNSTGNLFSSPPNHHVNNNNGNLPSPKRMLFSVGGNLSSGSASTSSLPIHSSGGGNASTKGMRLLQRSKAILSDATNFNYFDKFKNVVSPGGTNKEQTSSGSNNVGGGIRGLMKGRKPLIE